MSESDRRRLAELELLRALAAQLIVWHHLAYYGPMSGAAQALAPALFEALAQHGRLAVQVFLVLAGFLAAKSLAPDARPAPLHPLRQLGRRAARLMPAYWVALALAVAAATLARLSMDHEVIPQSPASGELLAHLLLLHTVLGIDSLSAGVWYVAIDLQLFALLAGLAWLARGLAPRLGMRAQTLLPMMVVLLAGASMWHFNRDPGWDAWGPYFFGSYALGIAAAWLAGPAAARGAAVAIVLLALGALAADFRVRLALALGTALLVWGLTRRPLPRWPAAADRLVGLLARTSYATFLVHFPVMLLVAALVQRVAPDDAALNAAALVLTWLASLALAALVQRHVEQPAAAWLARGGPAAGRTRRQSLLLLLGLALAGLWQALP
ncbi:acyltransferase family protein [Caldimonas tepidiphila]|uniref:acyltransferase family protein n=1 Tax=Caldimonas tepidiphila TaxID=2315841 RepID=UPI0013007B0C|nr:acyltransferase family protein [Caldimonas tepidiphila]